jgi:hypothetical protein
MLFVSTRPLQTNMLCSVMMPQAFDLRIKTAHYQMKMTVTEDASVHTITLQIGDDSRPCLLVNITTPGVLDDDERKKEFYDISSKTARLSNIEALIECAQNDITQDYFDENSLGVEILHAVNFILLAKFPFVKRVALNDKSYIPCNRDFDETLDLLSYSVALNGFTWYERTLNARIVDDKKWKEYTDSAYKYVSKEFKNTIKFEEIEKKIIVDGTLYAKQQLATHARDWGIYFENAETLPDFFRKVSDSIGRKNKCKFFKGWLESFIGTKVNINRDWVFDIPVDFSQIKKRRTERNRRVNNGVVSRRRKTRKTRL